VEPHGCGALAKSDTDKAWGGADRETLDAAKREAVEHCQTHTSTGHCMVVISACNR
jgi:phosphoserine phosphatase